MKPLNKLFSPINIGSMGLKNRIVMAPMNSRLGNEDGTVSQRLIDYYEARARGGAGLIVLPSISVDRFSPFKNNLVLWDDRFIPSFREVTEAAHVHGTRVVPQLCHPAPGMRPLSSLKIEDIRRMTGQFGDAARRAREAGCDGIELHAAHARLLLGSFISALCNRRTDAYGGAIESRLRLLIEVIEEIRGRVGPDFPIMVRISADELVPGGRNIRETQYIAPILAEAGIDAFDISVGVFGHPLMGGTAGAGSPEGVTVPYAKAVKEVVDVPVIAVGRINNPRYAEDILRRNEADIVALGRALIADPEWPKKAAEGRFDDIAPCVGCLLGCGFGTEGAITCLVNPGVGRESETALSPAPVRKKVLVAGAGPGGLEAARVSALRGHEVTLYEKEAMPGGQLNWASVAPTKQEFTRVIQYLWTQAEKAGVDMRLNREVAPQFIEEERPDVVIVATGIEPFVPDIPGAKGERIVTAYDVLAGKAPVRPGEAVVVGGGMVGCEVADFLADFGDNRPGSRVAVTIVEMMEDVCLDAPGGVRAAILERLREKGVKIITSAKVLEFLEDGILFAKDGREEPLHGANAIILAMGARPADRLSAGIKQKISEVYVIGDAKEPRRALEAVAEGADVGRRI